MGNTGFTNASTIAVDTLGNVYCAGNFDSFLDLDPGANMNIINAGGSTDGFIAKYSSTGTLIWGKAIGGLLYDAFQCIDVDASGKIIATGTFEGSINFGGTTHTSIGQSDIFVVKFDTQGQFIWSKSFGGANDETVYYLDIDSLGNKIAICGSFKDTLDFGNGPLISHGSSNSFVALLDANGNPLWSYGFGGSGTALDRANVLTMDDQGNVFVAGTFSGQNIDVDPDTSIHLLTSTGSSDIYMIKYSSNGIFQNAFSIGGLKGELAGGIAVNNLGDIYFTGYSNSDSIDVNPNGSSVYFYGDSGILFVQDLILLKYNSSFNYEWGFRTGRRATDSGQGLRIDSRGDVFVTGVIGDTNVDFDPGPGTHYLSSDSANALNSCPFLAQYSSSGSLVDAFVLDGVGSSAELAVDNDGKIWMCGYYRDRRIDLDPGIDSTIAPNVGQFDAFLASYNYPQSVGLNEYRTEVNFIHPNPCTNFIRIKSLQSENTLLEFKDLSGKLVKKIKTVANENISIEDLNPGIYIVSMKTSVFYSHQKIIKIN